MYPEYSGKLTSPDPATISLLGHWARSSHAKEDAAAAAEPAGTSTSWKPSAAEHASPSNTNPTDGYSLSSAACPRGHLWSRGPTVQSTSGYTDSQFENQVATTSANALFSNLARCWAWRLRSNPKLPGGCGPILNWSNPGSQRLPPIFRFRFVRPQLCRNLSNNNNLPVNKLRNSPSSSKGTLSRRHRRLQLQP